MKTIKTIKVNNVSVRLENLLSIYAIYYDVYEELSILMKIADTNFEYIISRLKNDFLDCPSHGQKYQGLAKTFIHTIYNYYNRVIVDNPCYFKFEEIFDNYERFISDRNGVMKFIEQVKDARDTIGDGIKISIDNIDRLSHDE